MAMTMVEDYYGRDLNDVAHRLLPREILEDVGIVVPGCGAPPSSCAVRRRGEDHAAVVEDLAAHLVGILGLDAAREHPRPHWQHIHEQRRRAGLGNGRRAPVPVGGGQYDGGAVRHAPPASCWNGTPPCLPRFEMAAQVNGHNPAMCRRAGTGVFLPRVKAYEQHNRASSTSPRPNSRNGVKPPRMQSREAALLIAQQQQLLHAMAAEMQRQREAFAAAFQFHACAVIAPPRQWTC